MGTRKSKVTIHRIPSEDHLGFFFSQFAEVSELSPIRSKAGIATSDVEICITLNRKQFVETPDKLMCGGRPICVIVEGRRQLCWACGATAHLCNVYLGTNPELHPQSQNTKKSDKTQTTAQTTTKGIQRSSRVDGSGEDLLLLPSCSSNIEKGIIRSPNWKRTTRCSSMRSGRETYIQLMWKSIKKWRR